MNTRIALVTLLALGGSRSPMFGASPNQNWPQWRGPTATGLAPKADPPTSWSEESNVKWKLKLPGYGTSTPIIWENQIFIQTAIAASKPEPKPQASVAASAEPGERPRRGGPGGIRSDKPMEPYQFTLLAIDRGAGKIAWQKLLRQEVPHEGHHPDHGFASASPITDGEHVISYFGSRGLYCLDLNGNVIWQKELGKMQTRNSFGEGSSPALFGHVLVVNWDHEGSDFVVAFDKTNGKELWRQPRNEPTGWSTPLVVKHNNRLQVVISAPGKV
ncbi:MAG TPA: PQQ-binding-like beta-propeller repeat protein, partial [Candidatus Binatia bacterium]|nr:PQQ-binding-like beta-propeller repeat protein [Candidatus Binatia bacterium]